MKKINIYVYGKENLSQSEISLSRQDILSMMKKHLLLFYTFDSGPNIGYISTHEKKINTYVCKKENLSQSEIS